MDTPATSIKNQTLQSSQFPMTRRISITLGLFWCVFLSVQAHADSEAITGLTFDQTNVVHELVLASVAQEEIKQQEYQKSKKSKKSQKSSKSHKSNKSKKKSQKSKKSKKRA